MPLLELRRRPRNQTLHRGLSKREISLKNLSDARNTTNKVERETTDYTSIYPKM
jgi:hypothetical protein